MPTTISAGAVGELNVGGFENSAFSLAGIQSPQIVHATSAAALACRRDTDGGAVAWPQKHHAFAHWRVLGQSTIKRPWPHPPLHMSVSKEAIQKRI